MRPFGTDLLQNMIDRFALESLHIRMFLGNCFDHKSYELDIHLDCLFEKSYGGMVLEKSVGA